MKSIYMERIDKAMDEMKTKHPDLHLLYIAEVLKQNTLVMEKILGHMRDQKNAEKRKAK